METSTIVQVLLVIIAILVLVALIVYFNQHKKRLESEKFNTSSEPVTKQSRNSADNVSAYNEDIDGEEDEDAAASLAEKRYGGSQATGMRGGKSKSDAPSFSFDKKEMEKRVYGGGESSDGLAMPRPVPSDLSGEMYTPVSSEPGPSGPKAFKPSGSIREVQELLPTDAANSDFAKMNPAGQGSVSGQQFLSSGTHMGINTVGQANRNASHDIRGIIPNPRDTVSPWMQSTIEPDLTRRPLE